MFTMTDKQKEAWRRDMRQYSTLTPEQQDKVIEYLLSPGQQFFGEEVKHERRREDETSHEYYARVRKHAETLKPAHRERVLAAVANAEAELWELDKEIGRVIRPFARLERSQERNKPKIAKPT